MAPYTGPGVHGLLALAHALQHVGSQVVVLQVFQALLDDLAQVIGLGAAGGGGQDIEALLGFLVQSDRGRHGDSRLNTCIQCITLLSW